jgi:NTF2-related export protein 1/2
MSNFSDSAAVTKKALGFRTKFYDMLDNPESRASIAALYPPNIPNLSEWNGHALSTVQDITNYLQSLPKTKHTIHVVDAHPLPGNENADSILLTVHGDVTYDDEHERTFYQRFVLREIQGKIYIFNDYYRWLSEKTR